MAAELEPRRRPHSAQRGDQHRIGTDQRRSRRGGICSGQSRLSPSAVRWIGTVGDVRAHGARTERRSRTGPGAARRDHRPPRTGDGALASKIRAAAGGFFTVGTGPFRRSGAAAARAVPAVLCLCRSGSDLAKHLARARHLAGDDQADGSRWQDAARPLGLDDRAGSYPGGERLYRPDGKCADDKPDPSSNAPDSPKDSPKSGPAGQGGTP